MDFLSHAEFSRGVKASHYLCEVSVLFLDGKGSCTREVMETDWIFFKEDLGGYEMEFVIQKGAKYFLIWKVLRQEEKEGRLKVLIHVFYSMRTKRRRCRKKGKPLERGLRNIIRTK